MSAEAEINSCNYSAAQAGGVLPPSRYQIPDALQMYWQAVALSGLALGATDPEQRGCRSERRPALWRRGQEQRWITPRCTYTLQKKPIITLALITKLATGNKRIVIQQLASVV